MNENEKKQQESALTLAKAVVEALNAKKAVEVKTLAVASKTVLADYFVVATGTSSTHIRTLADEQHREAQLTMYRMPILRLSYQDLINTKRFVEKLTAYGIPRDPHVADAIKRLGAKSPRTALLYQEMRIPKEIIEQFIAS